MLTRHRAVLWAGLCGTALLVLGGTFYGVSRVWASSFTQTLEVMVAAPFIGLWMLSPLLWVTRPGTEPDDDAEVVKASRVAELLAVGLGASIYLWMFAVRPLALDVALGMEALLVAVAVPGLQWTTLGGGAAARWASARREASSGPDLESS